MKRKKLLLIPLLIILLTFTACSKAPTKSVDSNYIASASEVPEFDGKTPYVAIKNNEPDFKASKLNVKSFEKYNELDYLGRCVEAMSCVGVDIMPTEDRGTIGQIKPTGWHTVKYDLVDGKYLYNRCHLIGFQLTGENANERNLITGTRYLNIEGMLPFENMIADYVRETKNHVLYRVTPIFDGNNLLASGVQMEAKSVEDNGEGICFNVYAYNAQPGIEIDYKTGESKIKDANGFGSEKNQDTTTEEEYILNVASKKIHKKDCKHAETIAEHNKAVSTQTIAELTGEGYTRCRVCNP